MNVDTYRVERRSDAYDSPEEFSTAQETREYLDSLKQGTSGAEYLIRKNSNEISEASLANDIALEAGFADANKLPVGHKTGGHGGIDDLGIGPDDKRNERTVTWKPSNPEDHHGG